MSREHLFKGKRVDNGEWVYGYYVKGATRHCVLKSLAQPHIYDVIPETVGQYVGFEDRNGKKIFEGDIVKLFGMVGQVCFENGAFGIGVAQCIDYKKLARAIPTLTGCDNEPHFLHCDNFISFWELLWNYNAFDDECEVCEVIGNIHDNKELLGE